MLIPQSFASSPAIFKKAYTQELTGLKSRMTRDNSSTLSSFFFHSCKQNLAGLRTLLSASTIHTANYQRGALFTLFLSHVISGVCELPLTHLDCTISHPGIPLLTTFPHRNVSTTVLKLENGEWANRGRKLHSDSPPAIDFLHDLLQP